MIISKYKVVTWFYSVSSAAITLATDRVWVPTPVVNAIAAVLKKSPASGPKG